MARRVCRSTLSRFRSASRLSSLSLSNTDCIRRELVVGNPNARRSFDCSSHHEPAVGDPVARQYVVRSSASNSVEPMTYVLHCLKLNPNSNSMCYGQSLGQTEHKGESKKPVCLAPLSPYFYKPINNDPVGSSSCYRDASSIGLLSNASDADVYASCSQFGSFDFVADQRGEI